MIIYRTTQDETFLEAAASILGSTADELKAAILSEGESSESSET